MDGYSTDERVLLLGENAKFPDEVEIVFDGFGGFVHPSAVVIRVHTIEELSYSMRKLFENYPLPPVGVHRLDFLQSDTGSRRVRGSLMKAIFERITPRILHGTNLFATAEQHEMIFDNIFHKIIRTN